MVYVASVGLGMPETVLLQEDAKQLVKEIFNINSRKINRLMPVFDHAKIKSRQLVTSVDWYKKQQNFESRNNLYVEQSVNLAKKAIEGCLHNNLLNDIISYEEIDLIVFVSSTGISTPSIDAYLINELPFRENIVRIPLWGLGCGGGASGLNRAIEWLKFYTNKNALVVCSELCSLTFQQKDTSASNIVGTALFGDGVAATLLIGENSNLTDHLPKKRLSVHKGSSFTKKNTLSIMGWDITEDGFEVIFSKKIPRLIKLLWKDHFELFLKMNNITKESLHSLIAHPGGRKVLEEMEEVINHQVNLLDNSYHVLANHGNMSSATVMYVLKRYLEVSIHDMIEKDRNWAILSALGPGFSSELIAMRWKDG